MDGDAETMPRRQLAAPISLLVDRSSTSMLTNKSIACSAIVASGWR